MDKKKLILITSPPACGKTFVAKNLAKALNNCVYLDKDDLIVLSRKIFEVAGEPFDRSSDFFHEWIRDAEYDAIMEVGLDALNYNDIEVVHQRMVSRNSERDTWKIEHWDEYVATQDYTAPVDVPEMFVFENSSEDEFEKSIGKAMNHIRGKITEV